MIFLILATIFLTPFLLTFFSYLVYLKYRSFSDEINLWILHPLTVFNGLVILTFYLAFLYHICFGTIASYSNLMISPENAKDLVIISLVFIFSNLLIYLIDLFGAKAEPSFKGILPTKQDVLLVAFFFVSVLFFHFFSFTQGTYYHSSLKNFGLLNSASLGKIGFPHFFLGTIRYFSWLGLAVLYFTRFSQDKRYKFIFWGLFVFNLIFSLPSGSKALVLVPLLLFSFCFLTFKKRGWGRIIVPGLLFFILFFGFYNTWRAYAQKRALLTYWQYLSESEKVQERGYFWFFMDNFAARMDGFSGYLALTDYYPQKFQFLKGKSYLPILTSPFPRIVFPSRPLGPDLNEIGRKTRILREDDYVTVPGIGWWGELYINFGYPGVLAGTIFILLFYQGLFIVCFKRGNFFWQLTYLTFLFYIPFTIQGGMAGVLGDFIKFLVFVVPFSFVFYSFLNKKSL